MIAARPSTPVVAAAIGSVPLYEVPVMPTLPVHQLALTSLVPSMVVKPCARPLSQSMTAFGASASLVPPTVGQPCDRPVPGDSECTTANPRGTQVRISVGEMTECCAMNGIGGGVSCAGGLAPSSCFGSQSNRFRSIMAV